MDIYEWIDRIQDIITLIAIPIAVYLLIRIYLKVKKLNLHQ